VHAYMDLATDFVQGPQSDQDAPVADLAAAPGDDDRAARGHEAQGPHIGQGRVIARRTASGIGSPARHGLGCWRGPRRGRPRRCVGTGSRRTRRRRRRGRRRWSGTAAAPTHRWVPGGRLEQDRSGRGQSRCVGRLGAGGGWSVLLWAAHPVTRMAANRTATMARTGCTGCTGCTQLQSLSTVMYQPILSAGAAVKCGARYRSGGLPPGSRG
jgi:hypothetical protein